MKKFLNICNKLWHIVGRLTTIIFLVISIIELLKGNIYNGITFLIAAKVVSIELDLDLIKEKFNIK